jgi:hypothetical protein
VLVYQGQQFAELARAVLQPDHAADPAIGDPKAGQQVDRAVAHVLEFASRYSASSRWLVWGGRFADANARLLVDTEQRSVGGRPEQKVDHGHGFGGELRVAVVHPGVKDGPGGPYGA